MIAIKAFDVFSRSYQDTTSRWCQRDPVMEKNEAYQTAESIKKHLAPQQTGDCSCLVALANVCLRLINL